MSSDLENIPERLRDVLTKSAAAYQRIPHWPDYTAQHTAEHTQTEGEHFAKVVILAVDERFIMTVLPAHHRVDFTRLRAKFKTDNVRLASEEEIGMLFPDCEAGAEPPFGNLYGMAVYLSTALAKDGAITFNAGTHSDALRMEYRDYEKLVKPKRLDFSVPGGKELH